MARGGLPTGVQRKHSRSCPARGDSAARCKRKGCKYQVQAGPRNARQTATFAELADAVRWRNSMRADPSRVGRRSTTVRAVAERWLAALTAGDVLSRNGRPYAPSTVRGYARDIAIWTAEFGDRQVDGVSRGEVSAVLARMQSGGRPPTTAANAVMPLRAMYRWAQDHDITTVNPTVGIRIAGKAHRRREHFAPAAAASALVAALPSSHRALWATAFYAGLRRGELMALRWADIDLEQGVIRVRASWDQQAGRVVTKTPASVRDVPVPEVLMAELLAHRERHDGDDGALVFSRRALDGRVRSVYEIHAKRCASRAGERCDCSPRWMAQVRHRGGRYRRRTFATKEQATRWQVASRRRVVAEEGGRLARPDAPFRDGTVANVARRAWAHADLKGVGLHEARHSFGSMLAAAGVAPEVVRDLMGHSSIATTFGVYVHAEKARHAEAVATLDAHVAAEAARSALGAS